MKHKILKRLHIHPLRCKDIYRHLCDNLDAKIDSEACRQIRAHVQACKNCTALLDSLKKTVYLYRSKPTPTFPSSLEKKLFVVINLNKSLRKKSNSK